MSEHGVNEEALGSEAAPPDDAGGPAAVGDEEHDDESWRNEMVADIFDGPPAPAYEPPFEHWNDFINHWIAQKKSSELEDRARERRASSR